MELKELKNTIVIICIVATLFVLVIGGAILSTYEAHVVEIEYLDKELQFQKSLVNKCYLQMKE